MNEKFYLVSFESSQKAIQIEMNAKEIIDEARLIPIPSEVHANCGLGLKVAIDKFDLIKHLIIGHYIYSIEKVGNKREVKRLDRDDLF
jgi:hypothetical protein